MPEIIRLTTRRKYPSLVRQGLNYLQSALTHALNGFQTAGKDLEGKRLRLCLVCPELDPQQGRCTKCGCPVVAKVQRQGDKCPVGKW
jgi:hypothetical protein